jgi:hypothetical protein
MERTKLTAPEGMILTDGKNYGRIIYLAEGADESAYYPITEAEYNAMQNTETDEATEADCIAALERFGVK